MIGRNLQIELPRRVAAHYLLFCLLVVLWAIGTVVAVGYSMLNTRLQNGCLARLGRATSAISLDYMRTDGAHLQEIVDRLRSEGGLTFCAIASEEGVYLAHTQRNLVGQPVEHPDGRSEKLGEVQRIHHQSEDGLDLQQYRLPLRKGERMFGTLHAAAPEPGLLAAIQLGFGHLPWSMLLAVLAVAMGTVVIYRQVAPFADIDRQLRLVALAPMTSKVDLEPMRANHGAALGWNRLVQARHRERGQATLNERLDDAAQQLQMSRSECILDSLSEGILVTDDEQRIVFANAAALALLDVSQAESVLGTALSQCLHVAHDAKEFAPLRDPQTRTRPVIVEVGDQRGGEDRMLRLGRFPLRGEDLGQQGFVWTVRDVTQTKLVEKMRDQFLDAATHELRTPLANIKAYAETLALSEMLDIEQQKEFCNTINVEATRLARFIDDLLSVSSMEAGALTLRCQQVDLDRLVREVVDKVRSQMDQKSITLETKFAEKLPEMELDKDKLSAALVNLLGNAAKYTKSGGHVVFRVMHNDGIVHIEVRDDGFGIAEEELPRIFEKFFRSGDSRVRKETGTGLGLSFAQEVIRLHAGELAVESKLNEGTTFSVTLPKRKPE